MGTKSNQGPKKHITLQQRKDAVKLFRDTNDVVKAAKSVGVTTQSIYNWSRTL